MIIFYNEQSKEFDIFINIIYLICKKKKNIEPEKHCRSVIWPKSLQKYRAYL